jgi:hypothetical protein
MQVMFLRGEKKARLRCGDTQGCGEGALEKREGKLSLQSIGFEAVV